MSELNKRSTGFLQATDVDVVRGGRSIVDSVQLSLQPGKITVIVGPNGAGKSSLLKCLTGETLPDSGTVELSGHSIRDLSPSDLAQLRAVLPQESRLSFDFSVEELVQLGRAPFAGHSSAIDDREIVDRCLARTDLIRFRDRLFTTLSGGERQRAQLARVLAQRAGTADYPTPFLFLDEPTSALDIKHQMDVLAIAREEARSGATVLAILHDINLAASIADQLVMMKEGAIRHQGPPREILTIESIREVFEVTMESAHSPHHPALFFPGTDQ